MKKYSEFKKLMKSIKVTGPYTYLAPTLFSEMRESGDVSESLYSTPNNNDEDYEVHPIHNTPRRHPDVEHALSNLTVRSTAMNKELAAAYRDGRPPQLQKRDRILHEDLQGVFADENNHSKTPFTGYHGISKTTYRNVLSLPIGNYVHIPTYMSTTTNPHIAIDKFAKPDDDTGEKHVFEIHADEDTPTISVRAISAYPDEDEVVIGAGTTHKLVGRRREMWGNKHPVVIHTLKPIRR